MDAILEFFTSAWDWIVEFFGSLGLSGIWDTIVGLFGL